MVYFILIVYIWSIDYAFIHYYSFPFPIQLNNIYSFNPITNSMKSDFVILFMFIKINILHKQQGFYLLYAFYI